MRHFDFCLYFYQQKKHLQILLCKCLIISVGVAGFEPAAPCSQSRCANRTALHPVFPNAERGGFEPPVPFRARMFSKHVVSATHPSLRLKSHLLRKRSANIAFYFLLSQMEGFFLNFFYLSISMMTTNISHLSICLQSTIF